MKAWRLPCWTLETEVGDMAEQKTKRLELSQPAKNLLWSESGGHCQNPQCRADLHLIAERERLHIGEFAHVIPASTVGPRAEEGRKLTEQDRAKPENIVLLCPTCHTVIDKAPTAYPAVTLRDWKEQSQRARTQAFGTPVFDSREEARAVVESLLEANKAVFDLYGPVAGDFDEDRADQWRRHVIRTIIPNNQTLQRLLQANRSLLTSTEKATFHIFSIHAHEFEERHRINDWTAGSTKYPSNMNLIFRDTA